MKNALSLVEVLVSVIIFSVVIASMIQVNMQSVKALENINNTNEYALTKDIISLVSLNIKEDKKFYISDLVKFDEDDIDKRLKEIKYEIDIEKLSNEKIRENTPYPILVQPTLITIEGKDSLKEILTIELEL